MQPVLSVARGLNFWVATGIGAFYLYFKQYRPEKIKLLLELKIDDAPLPVPTEINNVVEEVMNEMKLEKEEKQLIKPFMIQSLDLSHLGFSNSITKCFVGIPHYFAYKDRNDANFITLVENNLISRHSKEVQTLIDSMCLSQGAKKFGIAHELYELVNAKAQLISALPVLVVSHCNMISYLFERFSRAPYRSHYGIHGFIFFLGVVVYFLAYNLTNAYVEVKADFSASELGNLYVHSGIEYYVKKMKRNKILKKLNSKIPYTENGDIPATIWKPFRVPLSRRITYLRDLGRAKKTKPSVWSYILYLY